MAKAKMIEKVTKKVKLVLTVDEAIRLCEVSGTFCGDLTGVFNALDSALNDEDGASYKVQATVGAYATDPVDVLSLKLVDLR